uniref:Uncharacterized protein n=1 Tax=Rhipicephalus appendiculatus TaxID=34631 RepID=A0A131YC00_RHIAP
MRKHTRKAMTMQTCWSMPSYITFPSRENKLRLRLNVTQVTGGLDNLQLHVNWLHSRMQFHMRHQQTIHKNTSLYSSRAFGASRLPVA